MVNMTIKIKVLSPSLTCLQLSYMFVNNNSHPLLKCPFHVSINISNTLVDMYMKLHKHLDFDGPMCNHVFKCLESNCFTCKQQRTSEYIIKGRYFCIKQDTCDRYDHRASVDGRSLDNFQSFSAYARVILLLN